MRCVICTSHVEPMATRIMLIMQRMKTKRGALRVNREVDAQRGSPLHEKFWYLKVSLRPVMSFGGGASDVSGWTQRW